MSISSKIQNGLNKLVRRSYWYNNIAFSDCRKFWKHKTFDMDVVNLGSTSALAAFDYSDFPQLKAANWAMAPQTLIADYEILRNYSCFLKKGASVIIPLCPFSCLGGSKDDFPDKYYTVLNIASIPHASFYRKQLQQQIMQNPWRFYPVAQFFYRIPKAKNVNVEKEAFEADAIKRMSSWQKEFSILDFSYPLTLVNKDAYDDGVEILNQMIIYCKEHDFIPVVILPPVHKALSSQFDNKKKSLYIESFVSAALKGQNIKFLDYFNDESFSSKMFANSFILNEKGAKLFTKTVLKDLNIL